MAVCSEAAQGAQRWVSGDRRRFLMLMRRISAE